MELLNRLTLIALCEDALALKTVEQVASQWFTVVVTRSADRAVAMLKADATVTSLVVDHPGSLAILNQAREIRPEARRILVCCPGNLPAIVEGLFSGNVERIVYKPIRPQELTAALPVPHPRAKRATA